MPIKADKSLRAYYNEIDPYAAQWIRNLMAEGWITKGDVDERSIEDVRPDDLAGYDRLHFFAGAAVWDYALNQAGWGRREVWTGSCPCQPFSAAGKGAGFADERHLWPAFHHLISQCRPATVLGEQVASKDGLAWLDLVQADMEGEGYAYGAVDTCAAGFGAPHIRQRLYWVANDSGKRLEKRKLLAGISERQACPIQGKATERGSICTACWLGQPNGNGCEPGSTSSSPMGHRNTVGADGCLSRMATSGNERSERSARTGWEAKWRSEHASRNSRPGPTNGHWADADWLLCRDGKWRPVEPGTFPLVDGASARVVRLRGYGNAIVAPQAQAFIEAVMQTD